MSGHRRYESSWRLLLVAFIGALALEGSVGLVYELVREEPAPVLFVHVTGDGAGSIHAEAGGISCGELCVASYPRGTAVKLTVLLEEGSTFEGWESADCVVDEEWVLSCTVTLEENTHVTARLGLVPEVVEVAWAVAAPDAEPADEALDITLPDLDIEIAELAEIEPPTPEPDQPEPEPEPEPELKRPPPPEIPVARPELVPAPEAPPKPELQPPPPPMKAVEVPDENEVEEAPDDAHFLSDKNRDVSEETRAKDTNLEKASDGEASASEESDIQSEEIGAEEEEIAQLEDVEETSFEAERTSETETRGNEEVGEVPRGEAGDDGDDGDDHDRARGALSMRNIHGRGAPGGPVIEDPGRGGKSGRRGIKTDLDQDDYERIVGKEVAAREVELGRSTKSKKRGRWERKQAAVKSALENFVSEVKPGNQTALKTRAAPFALYITRMHRRIHELWGFGFLDELDSRPATDALNNWSLQTIIEVSINPDGTVHKTTIVGPSGVLMFDVAAIDTLLTASPYEETPEKIRSVDGRVYLHWTFRRDWEQCGTFNVRSFILTKVSSGRIDDGEMVRNLRPRKSGKPTSTPAPAPAPSGDASADSARAHANLAAPDDPHAEHAANLWLTGFSQGNAKKMLSVTGAPFTSGGRIVANSIADVAPVYATIIKETRGSIREWKLVSAAGYRQRFGAVPPGFTMTGEQLLMVVRAGGERFTLLLNKGKGGDYRVVGFHR